jgi:ABC-type Na+ efflux pump permease subunit
VLNRLLIIAKNTFIETLRQPIYAIIMIFALILMILAPTISMYTLDEDIKLLRELGLSTLFLAGLFIAVFAATGAISEEIETGTITTVLSKPISRPVFVAGKFIGLSAAVALAHLICTIAYLMAIRHGVLERASDEIDWTVMVAAGGAVLITFILTGFFNYAYDWNFAATGVTLATCTLGLGIAFLSIVDKEWHINPAANNIHSFDIYASILLLLALLTMVSLAVLFSTRFNEVVTLTCCVGVFLLGLISDWVFGRFAARSLSDPAFDLVDKMGIVLSKVGIILVPNLQIYWVSDAIYETGVVPAPYLLIALGYTALYTAGILTLSIAMFQKRQIG